MTMASSSGSGPGETGGGQAGGDSPASTPPAALAPEPLHPPTAATAAAAAATGPPVSPLDDRVRVTDKYQEIRVIGNGAYGTVYFAKDRGNQERVVALKKIRITLTEDGVPVSAVREISLLKQLERFEHPNIVRLLDVCQGQVEHERRLNLVLVLEYVNQDLSHYLNGCPSPGLDQARIKSLIHQILCGVDFLHSNRVIHRDLKPQNILVDGNGRVKITDFGLARIYDFNMRLTTMVVTLWYRAPEILLSTSYATPVDVWSCGCIFAELFRRRPMFEGHTEGDQLQRIFYVIGTPHERDWPRDVSLSRNNFSNHIAKPVRDVVPEITDDGSDLLEKMLRFVPSRRISAVEALRHPYFRELNTPPRMMATSNRSTLTQQVLSPAPLATSSPTTAGHHHHHHHHPRQANPSSTTTTTTTTTFSNASVLAQVNTNDENNPNAVNSANTNAMITRAPEPKVAERAITTATTSTNTDSSTTVSPAPQPVTNTTAPSTSPPTPAGGNTSSSK
ncbi:cyclin-dependent kinase 4-like [Portunus trituberculatus]|uniref:cyclin-dependent kinase 4-like n=1 Tax=Portunus trituberculatus TaxID=210409 RepID=UPI001E1CB18F|nr:cyclin-dependent kinase 4-like [Portunus trituberculatus]XP_045138092.1 cyclin-dependent kinase 4-like [Portunus trituberculatus]